MNLPNKLTILRICIVPLFVAAYFLPFVWAPWLAVGLFVVAAFTDFLDGYIARKHNLVTVLGKLLDPIADKMLVTAALFCIVASQPLSWLECFVDNPLSQFAWGTFGKIFITVCAILILSRELLIDAIRMVAASKGTVVQANIFGKIKTILQDVSLPLLVLANVAQYSAKTFELISFNAEKDCLWLFVLSIAGVVLLGLATVMTVVSGIIYIVKNKSVFAENSDVRE